MLSAVTTFCFCINHRVTSSGINRPECVLTAEYIQACLFNKKKFIYIIEFFFFFSKQSLHNSQRTDDISGVEKSGSTQNMNIKWLLCNLWQSDTRNIFRNGCLSPKYGKTDFKIYIYIYLYMQTKQQSIRGNTGTMGCWLNTTKSGWISETWHKRESWIAANISFTLPSVLGNMAFSLLWRQWKIIDRDMDVFLCSDDTFSALGIFSFDFFFMAVAQSLEI